MRYSGEVLVLGIVVAIGGWYARAPLEPPRRAAYLCAPVGAAVRSVARLQAALSDHDQVVPPIEARLPDLPMDCARLVLRWNADEEG